MTINLNETDDVNVSMNEDDDVDAMDMNMDIPDDGDNDSPGLDIDSYDFAKEQKYKKIGLAAIIGNSKNCKSKPRKLPGITKTFRQKSSFPA